ncbi:unnamed protein product [Fusarium equiseti]|uniref:Ig-like domain-containing protein n=1 Tax=Fusarium equiseti TaxID=61235 RepID=A0A8J2J0S8_FUSEQ|nr:unnamed protein product [Fusarium equiseti]
MPSLLLVLVVAASAASASVDVVWQYAKASQTSLSVYNGTSLLAQSCSSFLSDESASIDFSDVDENGFGNFTVGHNRYLVHSKTKYSGGPICTKKFNHEATVVECSGINWKPPVLLSFDNDFTCDPHQNYLHKQLSEVVNCGSAPSCSVGNTQSVSYTIGWTANLTPVSWISGGFSVSESWSTGNTYCCTGSTGEDVCVWYNTAHTAYSVQNMQRDSCKVGGGWDTDGDPFVMFSPNTNNRGGGYYCVIGTCRAQGDNYWDYSGRAGGP